MSANGISVRIIDQYIVEPLLQIHYPRVEGLPDPAVQEQINLEIEELVQDLLTNPDNLHPGYEPGSTEIIIGYAVEVNRNSILSLRFEVYSMPEMAANGFTKVKSLTVNLEDGQMYMFADLFIPGSGYVQAINEIIKQEFAARDIPMINEFESIDEDQEFYLTDNALVIYFQLFVYTPHYVGIPEFPIPYYMLKDYVNPAGPIANLM
jgi:hypothetical protein